uniref:Uncharacterized protein n=1 Tax=Heterorhabditis bacteriophora TaxID=37862 RepID=A0A1I7WH72_HETBA
MCRLTAKMPSSPSSSTYILRPVVIKMPSTTSTATLTKLRRLKPS